jgi:hypothetical protein
MRLSRRSLLDSFPTSSSSTSSFRPLFPPILFLLALLPTSGHGLSGLDAGDGSGDERSGFVGEDLRAFQLLSTEASFLKNVEAKTFL